SHLCNVEKPVNMAPRLPIHVRTAAEGGEPHLQTFAQQPLGHFVVKNSLLRKGDKLEIKHASEFGLHTLQRLHAAQLSKCIDLDVRAHGRTSVTDREEHDATSARIDILDGKCFLELGDQHLRAWSVST